MAIPASTLFIFLFSHSSNHCSFNFKYINRKSINFMFGIQTQGRRMVVTMAAATITKIVFRITSFEN